MQDPRPLPVDPPSSAEVDRVVRRVFEDSGLARSLDPKATADDSDLVRAIYGYYLKVREWLEELVRWMDELRYSSPLLYWLILIALLAVLALLIWHIAYSIRLALKTRDPALAAQRAEGEGDARRRHFADLHAEARRLAGDGHVREAARTLLLALLALLEERKTMRVARGWTTREVLERLATRIGHDEELHGFTHTIEAASYGSAALDPSTFEQLDRSVESLAQDLTSGRSE